MISLFIHDRDDLEAGTPGGVQRCTAEFLEIVRQASVETRLFAAERSRSAVTRLRRRLHLGSYLHYQPDACAPRLATVLAAGPVTHVFLNRSELVRFAPLVRRLSPQTKIVVMSHGNQSGDDLYEIAGPLGRRTGASRFAATWQLGLDLVTESWHRHRSLDGVCAMSAEEAALERWLGARRTVVLPRIIRPAPLDWQPVAARLGYVGTLDHTPNRAALRLIGRELQRCGRKIELRVVGGPESAGRSLGAEFSCFTYLGPMSEAALRDEARTWSVFLNPIFWLARGASMKLAQGLAWGLPVLTTESGRRGYEWREGAVPTTPDSPATFAADAVAIATCTETRDAARRAAVMAAGSSPSVADLAQRLRRAFGANHE